jgi:LDH2 family malate/lactate/ureidoglycolate dehydrogenase
MLVKISKLKKFIKQIILTEYSKKEADLMTDVLLYGELSGRQSHGLLRLLKGNYGIFDNARNAEPEYVYRTKVSTIIDAKENPGMLIGSLAMKEVIRIAKKSGIGIVGIRGYFSTTGAISYYCEKIAKENLICLIFPRSTPIISPFNAKKALFGTNPIAFGIPSDPQPIIFDMSTSAIAWGTVLKHKLEHTPLPEDVAIDEAGDITTDAQKAVATRAFEASYKGSGLAMIVELFGGLFTGAGYEGLHKDNGDGSLYLAFSPELLQSVNEFKQKTKEFVEILRNTPTQDGKKIRIPGENTLMTRDANLKKGSIEISDNLILQLKNSYPDVFKSL